MLRVKKHEVLPGGCDHRFRVDEVDTGWRRIWRTLIGEDLERIRTFVGSGTLWYEVLPGGFKRCRPKVERWLEEKYAEREYYYALDRADQIPPTVFPRGSLDG